MSREKRNVKIETMKEREENEITWENVRTYTVEVDWLGCFKADTDASFYKSGLIYAADHFCPINKTVKYSHITV